MKRWYTKCSLCLAVACVESEEDPRAVRQALRRAGKSTTGPDVVCGACGGAVEVTGYVSRARLVAAHGEASPCDWRCTNATGPSCDCSCGGSNHGSQKLVSFVVTDSIPRITPLDTEKSKKIAAEATTGQAAAYKAIEHLGAVEYREWAAGVWLEGVAYSRAMEYREARYAINDAMAAKNHKNRMTKLAAVVARYTAKAAS